MAENAAYLGECEEREKQDHVNETAVIAGRKVTPATRRVMKRSSQHGGDRERFDASSVEGEKSGLGRRVLYYDSDMVTLINIKIIIIL